MSIDNLILAIAIVESTMNPLAVGDNGESWGILQIQMQVIEDVNHYFGTDYKSEDRLEVHDSKMIFKYYTTYWASVYERNTGRLADFEILSKIWNGGAYGYNNPATEKYWIKVKTKLQELQTKGLLKCQNIE